MDSKLHTTDNGINLIFDSAIGSFRKLEPSKLLATGQIFHHYRVSEKFLIREKVLSGFKLSFLDAIELFTIEGCKITSIYRIRRHEWSRDASELLMIEHIKEYLYSKLNVVAYLKQEIDSLYHDEKNIDDDFKVISNFIDIHEK